MEHHTGTTSRILDAMPQMVAEDHARNHGLVGEGVLEAAVDAVGILAGRRPMDRDEGPGDRWASDDRNPRGEDTQNDSSDTLALGGRWNAATWEDQSLKCFGVIQVKTLAILEIGATQPFLRAIIGISPQMWLAKAHTELTYGAGMHACMHAGY